MLSACACKFEGLGAYSSEFEKLNNAIVRASMRGGAWYALAGDWQDRAVEERDWKIAIPPLWSSLMEEFWAKYSNLYRVEKNRAGLTSPFDIAPTGVSGALRDLWAPTVDTAAAATATAAKALQSLQTAAAAKVKRALQAAGREITKGVAEEAKDQGVGWGVWLAGAGIVGLAGYYLLWEQRARNR